MHHFGRDVCDENASACGVTRALTSGSTHMPLKHTRNHGQQNLSKALPDFLLDCAAADVKVTSRRSRCEVVRPELRTCHALRDVGGE